MNMDGKATPTTRDIGHGQSPFLIVKPKIQCHDFLLPNSSTSFFVDSQHIYYGALTKSAMVAKINVTIKLMQ